MNKLITLFVGLFMAFSACAQIEPSATYRLGLSSHPTYFPTPQAACAQLNDVQPAEVIGGGQYCKFYAVNPYNPALVDSSSTLINVAYGCIGNMTLQGSFCVCNAGFTASGNQCYADNTQCPASTGKPSIVNFTVGFTRTDGLGSNAGDYNCVGGCNSMPSDRKACSNGCQVELGEAVKAWRSTSPTSNGLYRISLDFQAVPSGSKCTAAQQVASPANKEKPPPPCPGFVGEINGKTTCVGTAAQPIPTNSIPRELVRETAPGNPAAGDKPATGEGSGSTGSGRTPSTGDGGNAGGPASAAGGPNGQVDKPTDNTKEQENCGAPGQPKCGIDEAGVPASAGNTFDDSKTKLENLEVSRKTAIENAQQINAPSWSFTFQLPTGCSPYSTGIAGVILDICQWQGMIHDLMSMIWAAATAFCIIGMVGRTIREA